MNRWLIWGSAHRALVASVAAVWFVVNVLTHDVVQSVALAVIDRLTIRGANLAFVLLALIGAGMAFPWFVRRIRRGPIPALKTLYVLTTALFMLLSGSLLFAVNSESIHFAQYGLLALLLFPLVGRVGETIVWVTLLGAVDEAYQYWVLHLHWGVYYDLNDVVLNLLGAAMGMMVLIVSLDAKPIVDRSERYTVSELLRSGALRAFVVVGLVVAGLLIGGALAIDPAPEDTAWAVLRRSGPPESFWVTPDWGRAYHVLSPVEGVLLVTLLMALYVPLDFAAQWLPRGSVASAARLASAGLASDRVAVVEED